MVTKTISSKLTAIQGLKEAIGAEKVKDDVITLATYAFDKSPFVPFSKPISVVLPESRDDVVATLKIADKHKIPVTVMGAGVSMRGLCVPLEGGIVLDMRRMNKVLEINKDSGYAVVEAGINFDQFSGAMSKAGCRFHLTTAPGGASVVGNYMLRSGGSGGTRNLDPLLDLEVVLPDGTVLNTGSSHFPSEGTPVGSGLRYGPLPDITGLYASSYGTMGVATKAAVRIFPKSECAKVAYAAFDNFESALGFVRDITFNNIPDHSYIWHWQAYMSFGVLAPDPANPLSRIPPHMDEDPTVAPPGIPYSLVTFLLYGYKETVEGNEAASKVVAKKYGGRVLTRKEAEALCPESVAAWDWLYIDYRPWLPNVFFGLGKYMPWIMMVEPGNVKGMEPWAMKQIGSLGIWPVCYYCQPYDYGRSYYFRAMVFADESDQEQQKKVGQLYEKMMQEARKRYGMFPFRRSPGSKMLQETGGYYELMKRIKKAIDPNNILSSQQGMFEEER